jgi:hypothetical protein
MLMPFRDDHAEECTHCHKVKAQADIKRIQAIVAVAATRWDPAALRREQLNDQDIGLILEEVETRQHPEWKEITDRSLTYKSYWTQWETLAMNNCILQRQWESANGQSEIAQIVLPRSRVKDVLTELHGEPSGGHLGVSKTVGKVRQRYYWLQPRNNVEKWCRQCDTCAASLGPQTRNWGKMHQCTVGALFKKIVINVVGPFPWSNEGNRYLLIIMDYFTKWPEVYAIPNQEASTVAEGLVANFFCHFRVPRELRSDQSLNFESRLIQVLQRLGMSRMHTMLLHSQSDGMVERYIKTVEEHTAGLTPANLGKVALRKEQQEQLGGSHREKQPQEERRLDAAETGRRAGASKMLKCYPPGLIYMSQFHPLRKEVLG